MSARSASPARERIATIAVYLAAAWVAAGALFKLFSGSPNDLPPQVRDALGDWGTTFRVAIAVESCVVIFALLRPRWGWLPLAALFVVFDAVLVPLVRAGAASCGCFGSRVPITPLQMLAIDSALLVLVLATRPWKTIAPRPMRPLLLLAPLFAIAMAAPWYVFRTAAPVLPPDRTTKPAGPQETSPTPDPLETAESDAAQAGPEIEWPDFMELHPSGWEGQLIQDTELQTYLQDGAIDQLSPDCQIVFFRQTCEHCQAHLEALKLDPPPGDLVLVRIPDPGDTPENEVTKVKPDALANLELRPLERGYGGFTPPAEMTLQGFIVGGFHEVEHEGQ